MRRVTWVGAATTTARAGAGTGGAAGHPSAFYTHNTQHTTHIESARAKGQVASGKWQVASGKWQVASERERSGGHPITSHSLHTYVAKNDAGALDPAHRLCQVLIGEDGRVRFGQESAQRLPRLHTTTDQSTPHTQPALHCLALAWPGLTYPVVREHRRAVRQQPAAGAVDGVWLWPQSTACTAHNQRSISTTTG